MTVFDSPSTGYHNRSPVTNTSWLRYSAARLPWRVCIQRNCVVLSAIGLPSLSGYRGSGGRHVGTDVGFGFGIALMRGLLPEQGSPTPAYQSRRPTPSRSRRQL